MIENDPPKNILDIPLLVEDELPTTNYGKFSSRIKIKY